MNAHLSITADFDIKDIDAYINDSLKDWFDELLEVFREKGREFTERARSKNKPGKIFNNITYNLRSSIGYCLVYENKIIETYFPPIKGETTGEEKGKRLAERIAKRSDHGNGIVLVLVAGEEYAVFVEAKSFDVVTMSFINFETEIAKLLN